MKKHSFNQNRINLKVEIDSSQIRTLNFKNLQKRDVPTSAFGQNTPQVQEGLQKITQQFVELTSKLQILNENSKKENNISQSKKTSTKSTRATTNSTYLFNNYLNQIEKNLKTSTVATAHQNENLVKKHERYSPKRHYDILPFEKENISQYQLRENHRDTTSFSSNFNFYQLDTNKPKPPSSEKTASDLIKQSINKNYELKLIPNTTKNNQDKFNFEFKPANQYFSPQHRDLKQPLNNNSIYQNNVLPSRETKDSDKTKYGSAKKAESQNPSDKKNPFEKNKIKSSKQQELTPSCKLDELQARIEQVKAKMLTSKNLNAEVSERPKTITESTIQQFIYTSRPEKHQKSNTQQKKDENAENTNKISQALMPSSIKTVEFFSQLQTIQNRTITQFRNCYLVKKLVKGCIFEQNQLMQQWLVESIAQAKAIQDESIMQKKVTKKSQLQQLNPKYQSNEKPILIFDLDETLVHCVNCSNPEVKILDDIKVFSIQTSNCQPLKVGIKLRPFVRETLEELSQYYDISVFTASQKSYADQVIDFLDNKKLIKNRWFREHCNEVSTGIFVKDLSQLGLNQNQEILIVDNAIISFACQLENGIPILPFYDDNNDVELKDLTQYLKKLSQWKNIIQVNKKVFQLDSFANFNNSSELVESLFPEQFSLK